MAEVKASLKGKGRLVWAAICLAPFLMTSAFINPALASIKAAFPDAPTFFVQNVSTAEALAIFLVGLIFGALVTKFSSKKLAIVGIILVIVFDTACALAPSLVALVIFRFIVGIGSGLMYPLCNRVIMELFEDREQRNRVMGFKTTMINVCSVCFSLCCGVLLAKFNWPCVFWALLVLVIPAIVSIVFLPDIAPKPKAERPKVKIPGKCWAWLIFTVIINLFLTAFMIGCALGIATLGIGDPSQAGYVLAANGVFGVISGFVYPYFRRACGRWTIAVILALYIVSYFMAGTASSMSMMWIAACINGFCFGSSSADMVMNIQETAGEDASSTALGFYSSALKLGSFFVAYVCAAVCAVIGCTTSLMAAFYIAIVVLIIAVILIPLTLKSKATLAQEAAEKDVA